MCVNIEVNVQKCLGFFCCCSVEIELSIRDIVKESNISSFNLSQGVYNLISHSVM